MWLHMKADFRLNPVFMRKLYIPTIEEIPAQLISVAVNKIKMKNGRSCIFADIHNFQIHSPLLNYCHYKIKYWSVDV